MIKYYVGRLVMVAVVVAILMLAEVPWWAAAATGVVLVGFFLWAPRSGRYVTSKPAGMAPLRPYTGGSWPRRLSLRWCSAAWLPLAG